MLGLVEFLGGMSFGFVQVLWNINCTSSNLQPFLYEVKDGYCQQPLHTTLLIQNQR
jgi:hypothetical protein